MKNNLFKYFMSKWFFSFYVKTSFHQIVAKRKQNSRKPKQNATTAATTAPNKTKQNKTKIKLILFYFNKTGVQQGIV